MTVYALIPVFNRLEATRRVLDCLHAQCSDEPIRVVVIDDGSTDGTGEFLATQRDLTVLKGDGRLWWGGAVQLGLSHVLAEAHAEDWVLLVNNDTVFASDFTQGLLDDARAHAPAVMGSVICDESDPDTVISIGVLFDTWRLRTCDRLERQRRRDRTLGPHSVDALSARGTLYPVAAFQAAGTLKPGWLPHYLADYELAVRVRKAGYRLLVSERSAVFSADAFGVTWQPSGLQDRFFTIRSPSYLPAVVAFWWRASSVIERLSLLPRLLYVSLAPRRSAR
jgi:GT2 family glycosyltransferase